MIHKSVSNTFYKIPKAVHKAFPYPAVQGPEDKEPLGCQGKDFATAASRRVGEQVQRCT